jgi:AcrR family transcriptional regulator
MSKKLINKEKKRSSIIYYSYEYFTIHGIRDFTMDDLLKYLQISKGTFYHYFDSKDELISSLFFHLSSEYITANKAKLESSKSLREKLSILYDVYLVKSKTNKVFIDLYKEFFLLYGSSTNKHVNFYNQKFKEMYFETLKMLITKEIKDGTVKNDSEMLINTIMATADGMIIYSCLFDEYDLSKEFSIFLDFLIDAIEI